MTFCAYCKNERELCFSHAIPDGFFKAISRKNNGQLISIPQGVGNVGLSQDTGKYKLLCKACESDFNSRFDGPMVNALKAWDRQIINDGFDVEFEFSANKMAQSLASICWRACVSNSTMYKGAKISASHRDKLLSIVDSEQENTLKLCSCSIKRLYDHRPPSTGGFPQEGLSQIILPVTPYRISWREKKPSNYFALAAVMQGFLCSLIIPKLPYDMRDGPEFLYPNRDLLHAPKQYFADYKPLMDAMVAGLGKHIEGRSTLKD